MEFREFSEDYVRRLAEGDRFVEDHFTAYFGELLHIKLRARVKSPDMIEEIRQETFVRVLEALRRPEGLEHPERLGAFVNSVCNHVLSEAFRNGTRHEQISQRMNGRLNSHIDLDEPLIDQERRNLVEGVLAALPKRDQQLLRMVYLDEADKSEACRRLGVGEDYLRVLLHRARSRCRDKLAKRGGAGA